MVMGDERKQTIENVDVKAEKNVGYDLGYWHFAKPFVEGGSATLLGNFLYRALFMVENTKFKMPPGYISGTLSHAALFGSYENIRRAAISANDQKPLSWFQEANCGLIAGAIGACVFVPTIKVEAAASRAASGMKHKTVYHFISNILAYRGILGLWKTQNHVLGLKTLFLTAMITSYNQSFNYFKNSQLLNDYDAHLGATAISGFITPLLSYPLCEAIQYRRILKEKNMGRTYYYTSNLHLAMEYIRLRGLSNFCSNLPKFMFQEAPRTMAFLVNLYFVRHLKIPKDS